VRSESRPNPEYVAADEGSPSDPLDAVLRLVLEGRTEAEHIQLILCDTLFDIAMNGDGRALVTRSPDDVPCLVIATGVPTIVRRCRPPLALAVGDSRLLLPLGIESDQVDLRQFERYLGKGADLARGGFVEEASRTWQRALLLWRGAPFAGISSAYASPERDRLVRHAAVRGRRLGRRPARARNRLGYVEVPCLVDANGVEPTRVGAASLSLDAIWRMCDDLTRAHGSLLPESLRVTLVS
jgi:hypothetical protein